MKQRILNLLIALDQLAWVLVTLGAGHPDETISAASYRMGQSHARRARQPGYADGGDGECR